MLRLLLLTAFSTWLCAADAFTGTLTIAASVDKVEGDMADFAELAKLDATIAIAGNRVTILASGGIGDGQWHIDHTARQGWYRRTVGEPWRSDPVEIEALDLLDDETKKLMPLIFSCTLTPTGETAEIVGHACKAYTVTAFQLIRGPTTVWIADDLPPLSCRMRLTTSEAPFTTLTLPLLCQLPIREGMPLKVTTTDQGATISYFVTAITAEARHPEPLPTR